MTDPTKKTQDQQEETSQAPSAEELQKQAQEADFDSLADEKAAREEREASEISEDD